MMASLGQARIAVAAHPALGQPWKAGQRARTGRHVGLARRHAWGHAHAGHQVDSLFPAFW